jgi:hypothetical protein
MSVYVGGPKAGRPEPPNYCMNDELFYENAADGNCLFESFAQLFLADKEEPGPRGRLAAELRLLACDVESYVLGKGSLPQAWAAREQAATLLAVMPTVTAAHVAAMRRGKGLSGYGTEVEALALEVALDIRVHLGGQEQLQDDPYPLQICHIPHAQKRKHHFRLKRSARPPLEQTRVLDAFVRLGTLPADMKFDLYDHKRIVQQDFKRKLEAQVPHGPPALNLTPHKADDPPPPLPPPGLPAQTVSNLTPREADDLPPPLPPPGLPAQTAREERAERARKLHALAEARRAASHGDADDAQKLSKLFNGMKKGATPPNAKERQRAAAALRPGKGLADAFPAGREFTAEDMTGLVVCARFLLGGGKSRWFWGRLTRCLGSTPTHGGLRFDAIWGEDKQSDEVPLYPAELGKEWFFVI